MEVLFYIEFIAGKCGRKNGNSYLPWSAIQLVSETFGDSLIFATRTVEVEIIEVRKYSGSAGRLKILWDNVFTKVIDK